jgi:ABC-2 type transport system permease protein
MAIVIDKIEKEAIGEKAKRLNASKWRRLGRGVGVLWLKHMKKFFGSEMEIIGTLSVPVLWMVLFGVCMGGTAQSFNQPGAELSYMAFITPGILLLTGLTAAVLGGATLLLERTHGTIKEYLVSPIPRAAIVLGALASSLTKAMGQAIVVLLLGLILGAFLVGSPFGWLLGVIFVVLYALGFAGIAVAFACKARGIESYHSIILLLNLPVLFLSNALYPLDKVPEIVRILAYFNPTTYAIDATRHLFFGAKAEIGLAIDLTVLIAFAALGLWFGFASFKRAINKITG